MIQIEPWFIYSSLAVISLAAASIAQKITLTSNEDISAETTNFFVWIFQAILGTIYLIAFNIPIELNLETTDILLLFLIGSIYFWAGTFFFNSFKGQSASISTILQSFSVLVSTTLGIIVFSEGVSLLKFFAVSLVLISIIFVNYKKGEKLNKYNLLALMGGALYGLAYTIDKKFSTDMNPHVYLVMFCLSVGFTGLVYRGNKIYSESRKKLNLNLIKVFIASALSFFIFNALTFKSYSEGGEVGPVDAINNSVIFVIILLEAMLLKDRANLQKKILASVISFTGVIILSQV